MLEAFSFVVQHTGAIDDEVVLTYAERQKSRHRTQTLSGKPLGWFVERGHVLRDGEVLVCDSGEKIRVVAAPEAVSTVAAAHPLDLLKAAYHLGNRHVPLQIELQELRFQHDHVLDEMLVGLGLQVAFAELPFHPESGAYHQHGHHDHDHDHGHKHEHHD